MVINRRGLDRRRFRRGRRILQRGLGLRWGGRGRYDFLFFLFFSFLERVDNESDVLEMSRETINHHRTMFWWFGCSQGYSESQRILWQKSPPQQQQQRQLIIFPRGHPLLRNTFSRRTRHVPSRITRCCSGRIYRFRNLSRDFTSAATRK